MSDLEAESDWTPADRLSLWFYGDPCNAIEPMYVALEDMDKNVSPSVYYDRAHNYDPNDINEMSWHQWNVDLTEFTGIDRNEVNNLYIGFGDRVNPVEGTGCQVGGPYFVVYFEDIRLYPSGCVPAQNSPSPDYDWDGPDDEEDCAVDQEDLHYMTGHWLFTDAYQTGERILHWKFDDDGDESEAVDSSGKGHHGSIWGADYDEDNSKIGDFCLSFNGTGDCVNDVDANEYMNGLYGLTVSLWINHDPIGAEETGSDEGFIVFDTNIADAPDWGDRKTIRYDIMGGETGRDNIIVCGVTTNGANKGDPLGGQHIESSEDVQVFDEWQHVAMTWSTGENVKLYIDGRRDYYTYTEDPPPLGTTESYLGVTVGKGKDDSEAGQGWDGKIDDVHL
jgi:hypothetical protein